MTQIRHTPINSTTEDTIISSAENITERPELGTHVIQGQQPTEPSNSRFTNLENPTNNADHPTLGVPAYQNGNTVQRPYNQAGVTLTDEQRIETKHTILEVYGKCINWQTAIEAAGIHRDTLNYWRSIGYI